MLLSELQKQQEKAVTQDRQLAAQNQRIDVLTRQRTEDATEIQDLKAHVAELNDLRQQLHAALRELHSDARLVAKQ